MRVWCYLWAFASAAATAAMAAQPALDVSVYDRASRYFVLNEGTLVLNRAVTPHWRTSGSESFTYRKELGDGKAAFVRVDAATGARTAAFDARVVAAGLAKAMGKEIEPEELPFKDFDELAANRVRFSIASVTYTCSTRVAGCSSQSLPQADPLGVPSPDGQWIAFSQDHNLWVRKSDGTERFALTHDGAPHYAYGGTPEANPLITEKVLADQPSAPVVLWSPDSRHLLTQRLDERRVREVSLSQSAPTDGTPTPRLYRWRYAMATDAFVPLAEPWIFDIAAKSGNRIAVEPIPTLVTTSIEAKEAWWSPDNRHVYLFARSRYYKTMKLYEVDAANGASRTVVAETGATFVEAGTIGQRPMVYVLRSGDVIWFSERDGRGHLYVYDKASGELRRRLTQGDWSVRGVLRVDETQGFIYVLGSERDPRSDPYYRKVYRIRLSDGLTALLTPEDADHYVTSAQESAYFDPPPDQVREPAASRGFSPSGRYFLDTFSRADLPPQTVLRHSDGRLVAEIERSDVSRVVARGLTTPERFNALAADGKTRLYGNILRPSNFDPNKQYPVIDSLYPGPQARKAYPRYLDIVFGYTADQTLAELGFVVIQLDGRGTPGRSKYFLDESYGKLGLAGHLDDHVAVIRELAQRYSYIDLKRVGVYGGSAGGDAALRALLTYPDFFAVGVSAAGSHDPRKQSAAYSETFMGPDDGANYRSAANVPLVGQLKGKLLLLHGDMDWTVLTSNTLQVVDALIKHNKDFELLIVPNVGHSPLGVHGSYALRRTWDFLVENLLHIEPPIGYDLP